MSLSIIKNTMRSSQGSLSFIEMTEKPSMNSFILQSKASRDKAVNQTTSCLLKRVIERMLGNDVLKNKKRHNITTQKWD